MHYYFGLILFIVNFMACSTVSTTPLNQYDLAIKNVKIFDSKNKKVIPNKTILIKKDQIAEIIDATEAFQADKIIEGDDRLVTPGFIDPHVHLMTGGRSLLNVELRDAKTYSCSKRHYL